MQNEIFSMTAEKICLNRFPSTLSEKTVAYEQPFPPPAKVKRRQGRVRLYVAKRRDKHIWMSLQTSHGSPKFLLLRPLQKLISHIYRRPKKQHTLFSSICSIHKASHHAQIEKERLDKSIRSVHVTWPRAFEPGAWHEFLFIARVITYRNSYIWKKKKLPQGKKK